jgi:hypothetical protein
MFTNAFIKRMEGFNAFQEVEGLGGLYDAIGLNPQDYTSSDENLRFLIGTPGMDRPGNSFDLKEGDEFNLKYTIVKFSLPQGDGIPIDFAPLERLGVPEVFAVDDKGRVALSMPTGASLLPSEQVEALLEVIKKCDIARDVPNWLAA